MAKDSVLSVYDLAVVGSPTPTFRGDLFSSSLSFEILKTFLDMCYLEKSGSKYPLTQRHIPEEFPNLDKFCAKKRSAFRGVSAGRRFAGTF